MPQLEGSLCPGRLGPIRRFRTARDRSATVPATARPSLSSWGAAKSMRAIPVGMRALFSLPSSVETRALLSPPSPVESRALQQPSKLAGPRLVGLAVCCTRLAPAEIRGLCVVYGQLPKFPNSASLCGPCSPLQAACSGSCRVRARTPRVCSGPLSLLGLGGCLALACDCFSRPYLFTVL